MTTIWQKIETFFTTEVEPAIAGFFSAAEPDIIDAITPILSNAVRQEQAALSASAGDIVKFAEASAPILASAAAAIVEAGVEATAAALLQAFTAAVAAIQPPTVTAVVTPAPAPTAAPTVTE